MCLFRLTLDDCGLHNLGFMERWYTWERDRFARTNIHERLDRGVANQSWWDLFLDFSVKHLCHSIFDHCLIMVTTMRDREAMHKNGSMPFRFDVNWVLEEDCESVIQKFWESMSTDLSDKLRDLGLKLR